MSRAAFFKLHSWLGLVSGAFMLVIAWTGSIAVFEHEIDWLLTPQSRAEAGRPHRPLDEIVGAARAAHPGLRVAVHLPYGSHWTYTAYAYGKTTRFLHIDPATATVVGDQEMRGYTWNTGYFIRQLHVRLLMGLWGRVFVGLFGVVLVLSVITSLWIYRDWLRSLVRIRRHADRRIFHMDLHKAVGLWALAFNLMFGITGAILGIENVYYQIQRARGVTANGADRSTTATASPYTDTRLDVATIGSAIAGLATVDADFSPKVIDLAPDLRAGRGVLVVRGDHPGALIANDTSSYTIDMATGRIAGGSDARRAGWGTYLYNVLDPLHFGYLGDKSGAVIGYVVKIIWALIGLTPGVLSITGAYMWMLRRRRVAASAAVRALRGGSVPRPAAAAVAVAPVQPGFRSPEWRAALVGSAAFLLIGYWLQVAVWNRGWVSELLWQHWIIKPLCLTVIALPLTLGALWLGGAALHAAGRFREGRNPRPATSVAMALGFLSSVPLGLLYLAGTAVLN